MERCEGCRREAPYLEYDGLIFLCPACMRRNDYDVLAVRVDERPGIDDWFWVAEAFDEVEDGDEVLADQCGNCGGTDYHVSGRSVVCGECTKSYPLQLKPSSEVIQ